ncbi:MAG: DUF1007 family protein [Bauldia sp.]|nr:DUF1007 family protein [Bauldia sp.]
MLLDRGWLCLAATFLTLGVGVQPATAHPHVWIDVRLEIVFDEAGRLAAVRQHWALDSSFTLNEVMQFVDGDGNLVLSPPEVERALAYYFGWIVPNRYFTRITIDGTAVRVTDQPAPEASFADGFFFVDAELRLDEPVAIGSNAAIDVYDAEIYYSFDFPREGSDRPGPRSPPEPPVVADAIVAVDAPPRCSVGKRAPEALDPMAVVLLRRLGLAAPNDDAAGFPTRAVILCR